MLYTGRATYNAGYNSSFFAKAKRRLPRCKGTESHRCRLIELENSIIPTKFDRPKRWKKGRRGYQQEEEEEIKSRRGAGYDVVVQKINIKKEERETERKRGR